MKFTFPPESRPLDGYTIKRAIHRGGFGEVYYALSDGGKEVALKLLQHETEIELRGIQQCLNLKHPNLLSIFDIRFDGDGDHWIVMEYVAGKSLADAIAEHPDGMPVEEVRRWLTGIARGLSFLHDRGIVHRDLKPANVHLDQGVVKIGDVGLSKFISQSRRNEQTQSVGTVYYMAPEVAHGRYGREVDVYSLGIVLYEMLTSRVPFDGETTGEILMKHLTERPDLEPLPPRLRPVIARALAKDPAQRTPTVDELERDFQRAVRGGELPRDIPEESFVGGIAPLQSAKANGRHVEIGSRVGSSHQPAGAPSPSATVGPASPSPLQSAASPEENCSEPIPRWAFWLPRVVVGLIGLASGGLVWGIVACAVYELVDRALPGNFPQNLFVRNCSRRRQAMRKPPPLPPVRAVHRAPTRAASPEAPRSIPLRQRLAELTASMAIAVPYAALITATIAVLTPQLFHAPGQEYDSPRVVSERHSAEPGRTSSRGANRPGAEASLRAIDPGTVGLFAFVTLFGAWGVLAAAKLQEGKGRRIDWGARRVVQFGVGLLVGAAAFVVGERLLAAPGLDSAAPPQAVFASLGVHPLVDGASPTLAGYMVFFGGLFALRNWWGQADPFRPKRFRIGSLLLTVLIGFYFPLFFAFPQAWGALWAAVISSVVQLSAPWVPPEERGRFVRA